MVGITEIALFKRLQRELRKKGSYFLRVADSKKQKRWGLGRYYTAGPNGVDKDADIEKLARELKVLEPWETVSKG